MSGAVRCFSMTAVKAVKPARKIKIQKNTETKLTSLVEQSEGLVLYKDSKSHQLYASSIDTSILTIQMILLP